MKLKIRERKDEVALPAMGARNDLAQNGIA
jgi:hypothetical protein